MNLPRELGNVGQWFTPDSSEGGQRETKKNHILPCGRGGEGGHGLVDSMSVDDHLNHQQTKLYIEQGETVEGKEKLDTSLLESPYTPNFIFLVRRLSSQTA